MVGNVDPDGREVAQRACTWCGAGLRRGQSGGVCDPCSRRPLDVAARLREAGFFTREPIRRALAALDFGYLFRAVRRAAGLTQVELGEVLELDQDRISRIERGERQLKDFEIIARIASRLGIPPVLLGFSADPTGTDSLISLTSPADNDGTTIAEYSEERSEGSTGQRGDETTQLPSLTQFCLISDIATLLVLVTAAAQSINAGKGYNELLTSLRRLVDRMNRRGLLQLLGLTTTSAFASPLLDGLDPGEQERVVAAIVQPERVDAQVIAHIESVLFDAILSNDKLGPRAALHTVLAQQKTLETMAAECPDEVRPRLLSVLGNSLRIAGWVSFNADDLAATRQYYEQARVVAHNAQDVQLATMVLANSSHAVESSGNPAMAVDYSAAAQTWAERAHHAGLSAFASDIGACAFAAMGDYNTTMRHLENTQAYLPECSESQSAFYTYSEGAHVARRGKCLLQLGRTADAVQVIDESLTLYAGQPDFPYRNINIAMAKLDLSAAHVQAGDIDEGAATLASVADFVSQNRADRLVKRVRSIRATLAPWQDTPVVKQLDDQLHAGGVVTRM
jgi:transcriptional regulator with XRE-family HTH domain/tetratricopeptide (TPR) repeat protein